MSLSSLTSVGLSFSGRFGGPIAPGGGGPIALGEGLLSIGGEELYGIGALKPVGGPIEYGCAYC